jgi:hypothetical protein
LDEFKKTKRKENKSKRKDRGSLHLWLVRDLKETSVKQRLSRQRFLFTVEIYVGRCVEYHGKEPRKKTMRSVEGGRFYRV